MKVSYPCQRIAANPEIQAQTREGDEKMFGSLKTPIKGRKCHQRTTASKAELGLHSNTHRKNCGKMARRSECKLMAKS